MLKRASARPLVKSPYFLFVLGVADVFFTYWYGLVLPGWFYNFLIFSGV